MHERARIDPPPPPEWVETRIFGEAAAAFHRDLDLERSERELFTKRFRVGFLIFALVAVLALMQAKDARDQRAIDADEQPYRPLTVSLADCPELPEGGVPLLFLTVRVSADGASVERCFRAADRPVELKWLSR